MSVNTQGFGDVALSEDARVTLSEVLRPLNFSIAFVNLLAQLATNGVYGYCIEVPCIPKNTTKNINKDRFGHKLLSNAVDFNIFTEY